MPACKGGCGRTVRTAVRCAQCTVAHREEAARLRASRKRKGLCTTCGDPAAVGDDGTKLTVCATHREYYRARDEQRRAAKRASQSASG